MRWLFRFRLLVFRVDALLSLRLTGNAFLRLPNWGFLVREQVLQVVIHHLLYHFCSFEPLVVGVFGLPVGHFDFVDILNRRL